MFIRTPQPFAQGTRLAIDLEVRGRVLAFAEVEVAWSRNDAGRAPGSGVKFTQLAPRARALVDHLVFLCSPPRRPPSGPRKQYNVPPGLKLRGPRP